MSQQPFYWTYYNIQLFSFASVSQSTTLLVKVYTSPSSCLSLVVAQIVPLGLLGSPWQKSHQPQLYRLILVSHKDLSVLSPPSSSHYVSDDFSLVQMIVGHAACCHSGGYGNAETNIQHHTVSTKTWHLFISSGVFYNFDVFLTHNGLQTLSKLRW